MRQYRALNIVFGSLISIALLLLGRLNPYLSILLLMFLGLNLSSYIFNSFQNRIGIAGAIGFSVLILVAYILSILGIGLSYLIYVMPIITALTFDSHKYAKISKDEALTLGKLMFIVGLIAIIKVLILKMPTDTVDSVFHAYKVQYILKYQSLFPPKVPVFNMLSYPAGYHTIVTWVVLLSGDLIPHAMLVVRVWSWILIVLGTYLFASVWFDGKVGIYSTMVILVTNIYNYYLMIYIHPNFLGFYFFMATLSLFYLIVHKKDTSQCNNRAILIVFLILITTGTLFVHPYEFQAYVFIAAVYLLLSVYYKELTLKQAILNGLLYFVPPLVIYAVLNPYFWWPELASNVAIEYPWAHIGVSVNNLAVFTGRNIMDTWDRFRFMVNWATLRNYSYFASLLLVASVGIPLSKRYKLKELASLWSFVLFVLVLILNRLTYNVPVPFYGTAAMERMFLWLTPLFPVFIAVGFNALLSALSGLVSSKKIRVITLVFLVFLFIVPAQGIAYDMISDEANYYVDAYNLEDFEWINERFSGITVMNSCDSDSGQWIPFFTSNTVLFSYVNYCRVYNYTSKTVEALIQGGIVPLNATLAYIDTNYPSLNPLIFYTRFKLLRYNNGNWIFDLTSKNTSENYNVLKSQIMLCKNTISGNTYEDGRYYVYGFKKKYFMVEYFHLHGLDYAWLFGQNGTIIFVPCKNYSRLTISFISFSPDPINTTILINEIPHAIIANPGDNVYGLPAGVQSGTLNIIEIKKERNEGLFLIKSIEFSD
ncbi:DUF6541 family protein [Thermococcus sp. GR6]|uniref:DUF6541 family protein n=1 Tax=Thermococcus sp. GR6 TaxID=1638256 RepID=UPI0014314C1F|nr:DUF6541 family protein [Thermococcus sp. GR6]NJE42280.1 hypothetical protein [Thermococcus sp. GR6]